VPPAKPSALAAWLGSHSLVYALLTSHAISIPKLMAKPKPTEVELLGRYRRRMVAITFRSSSRRCILSSTRLNARIKLSNARAN